MFRITMLLMLVAVLAITAVVAGAALTSTGGSESLASALWGCGPYCSD